MTLNRYHQTQLLLRDHYEKMSSDEVKFKRRQRCLADLIANVEMQMEADLHAKTHVQSTNGWAELSRISISQIITHLHRN